MVPELGFRVVGVEQPRWAAVPTLEFQVEINGAEAVRIQSITLICDIRIAPARREYLTGEQELLVELFGEPSRWASTLRPLPWARVTSVVGAFTDSTTVMVPVACGYDVELAVTKYLHAVRTGGIPLDFLFSGSVFYTGEDERLRSGRISWSAEATFSLPGDVWQQVVKGSDRGRSWLRLAGASYERLYAYKSRHSLTSWDEAVEHLLDNAGFSRQESIE